MLAEVVSRQDGDDVRHGRLTADMGGPHITRNSDA